MSGRVKALFTRAIRVVGRFIVAVAVVGYTVLDELLFPLFHPLIRWLTGLRLFQRIGEWLGRLPSYAALVALGIPFVIIEPMKVVAIWWAGTGHIISGTIALLMAHVLSLLVVDEVVAGRDLQRVRQDARAGVRRGTEADDLRAEDHRAVVAVVGQVVDAGLDRHRRRTSRTCNRLQIFMNRPATPRLCCSAVSQPRRMG